LEASSTQNDLVTTFFLLALAERLLAWRRSRHGADAAYVAIAAGLSLAAKGTAYLIGFPFGLWFLVAQLKMGRRSLLPLLACGGLILLPNLAFYARNFVHTGSPLGNASRYTDNNAAYGLGDLALNGARNLAINFATSNKSYDKWLTHVIRDELLGLGLDPMRPRLPLAAPDSLSPLIRTTRIPPPILCNLSSAWSPRWRYCWPGPAAFPAEATSSASGRRLYTS
jgi:hypothetical protein